MLSLPPSTTNTSAKLEIYAWFTDIFFLYYIFYTLEVMNRMIMQVYYRNMQEEYTQVYLIK